MTMYNPPHPGEFIKETYMLPFGISCKFLANKLGVGTSTLNRILQQQGGISPKMALRLSMALGRSPESWLAMQNAYDLWIASKTMQFVKIQKIVFTTEAVI